MGKQTQPRGLGRVKTTDDLKTDTLHGDVRDLILQEMRDAKNALPWTTRSEKEQREMIDRADRFAGNLIAKVVNLVAAGNNPAIPVTIKKWTVSDELQIALSTSASHAHVSTMIDGGLLGFLVFADKEPFQGEREPIQAAKDQPSLIDDDDEPEPEAEAA